jgi:hypothetical protein
LDGGVVKVHVREGDKETAGKQGRFLICGCVLSDGAGQVDHGPCEPILFEGCVVGFAANAGPAGAAGPPGGLLTLEAEHVCGHSAFSSL